MQWQDLVLTFGSIIFIIALLPSVFSSDKPAISTSLMTASVLLVFSFVYVTLSLTFAAVAAGTTGIIWLLLAFQKHQQNKNGKNK